ncbi:MAG: phosphatase PAP2 family protein [Terracidiphilus sp.]|jgi:hypothetical protein
MLSLWFAMALFCLAVPIPAHTRFVLGLPVAAGALPILRHFHAIRNGDRRREELRMALIVSVGFIAFGAIEGYFWNLVTRLTPTTFDVQLARWDMGVAPAVRVFAKAHWWLSRSLDFLYDPALWIACMAAVGLSDGQLRRRLLISLPLGGLLVIPCYLLFPAVGPIHVGDPQATRNCMPSMHLTWALLLAINSKGWSRWILGSLAALTAVATLSTGEHYYPDLVAALPWTWFLMFLTKKIVG